MTSIYLAGPISNLTKDKASTWRDEVTKTLLAEGFTVLNPVRGSKHQRKRKINPKRQRSPTMQDTALVFRDYADIDSCDVVLMNLSKKAKRSGVSFGSSCEFGYAWARDTLIVAVIDADSPYDHPFARASAVIFRTLEEAVTFIIKSKPEAPNVVDSAA